MTPRRTQPTRFSRRNNKRNEYPIHTREREKKKGADLARGGGISISGIPPAQYCHEPPLRYISSSKQNGCSSKQRKAPSLLEEEEKVAAHAHTLSSRSEPLVAHFALSAKKENRISSHHSPVGSKWAPYSPAPVSRKHYKNSRNTHPNRTWASVTKS